MKVILLQDVARIGRRFDVKDVPRGHALNYLIPRKMAEPATKENLRRVEAMRTTIATNAASRGEAFAEALSKLSGIKVELSAEANKQGHLFSGIKADKIAARLEEKGYAISADEIVLAQPIKETGDHTVTLRSGEMEGTFVLTVTAK